MILVDTSGLIAALVVDEPRHLECATALSGSDRPLVVSPFVVAETDYMLHKTSSFEWQLEFLKDVGSGAYELAPMDSHDVDRAREIMSRYRDLEIGLTDASIVVLAERHQCFDVLTLDERHFRALRVPGSRRPFRIVPADL